VTGRVVGPGFHERVYEVVSRVPPGSVATYGDVAGALGARSVARHVGFALAALPADRADVPWHRIVNGRGRVSTRGHGSPSDEQIRRLAAEGVEVDANGRVLEFTRIRRGALAAATPGARRRRT
jgi:methylated-DNA-protein-cysteine methyltransferase-like protein